MKKSLLTRGLAIGMICTMAFSCACGKKKDNIGTDSVVPTDKIDKEHVYTMEDMVLPGDRNYYIDSCCSNKDSLFIMARDIGGNDYSMKVFKMSYEDQAITEIALEDKAWYDRMECDKDGNVYLVKTGYATEEYTEGELEGEEDGSGVEGEVVLDDGTDSEEGSAEDGAAENEGSEAAEDGASENEDESTGDGDVTSEDVSNEESSDDYTIVKIASSGEKLWEAPLTAEDAKNYIQAMKYVDGKGILTNCNGEFSLYDENTGEGKSVFTRHEQSGEDDYYYSTLYRMQNGDVYLSEDNWGSDGKLTILKLNKDKMEFDEEVQLPDSVYGGDSLQPGNAYDFYVNENSEIRAFNIGDEKTDLICDFTASDMLVDYVNYIADTPDGQIMISFSQDDETCLAFLSKVDPNEVSEKETLTIGTIFVPSSIRQQVVKFNRKSDKYRINIIDYASEEDGDDSDTYMAAASKIGLELTQGQAPDMLVIDFNMPVESYAEKGALEPLDPYFEADQEINVTDFLENIVESTKVDGKIYTVIPSFNIETCVVAKDKAADGKITLENYKDICAKNGIDPQIGMGGMTRSSAAQLYSTVGTQFIDFQNGTCSFDSQGFIDLLNFIKDLPEDSEFEDIDYEEFDTYYRENKSLLMTYYVNSFEDYQVLKKGYFGKDIEFNGFPAAEDGVSYLRPYIQLAMNSDCKHKDAAWEFIKSFLTDEFQKDIEWSFPVKNSAIDALAEKAQEKPYYIDSNGKKVETESTWSAGGVDVKIEELSKEETTEFMDFVKSVTASALYEEKIINIIDEEAGAFYEGQKSAEEVADIIQSRVQIYMSENM